MLDQRLIDIGKSGPDINFIIKLCHQTEILNWIMSYLILTDIARLLTLECVERTSLQEKQLEHSVAPQIISPQRYVCTYIRTIM